MTFNLQRPQRGLQETQLLSRIYAELDAIEADGCWIAHTGVIMPDHAYLLVPLGTRMTLAGAVRHFKGRLTPALHGHGLRWQRSFFDHRLRRGEDALPIFLYILLNPYREELVRSDQSWPDYFCAPNDWEWFRPLTDQGMPFPEWLAGR